MNFLPVIKEVMADIHTPISVFNALRRKGARFILESVEKGEHWGRYSIIGMNPIGEVITRDGTLILKGVLQDVRVKTTPVEILREIMSNYRIAGTYQDLPPFAGGLAGFFAYETLSYYEKLPKSEKVDVGFPDAHFLLTTELVVFDHLKNRIRIVCLVPEDSYQSEVNNANKKIEDIIFSISNSSKIDSLFEDETEIAISTNFTKEMYLDSVVKAKEYIVNGDILQVVLARQLKCSPAPDPFTVYRRLRSLNPSPYMFFMEFEEYSVVGSSPECLAKLENGIVETCPIAGTRPRGKTPLEDANLAKDLLSDEKELAEHTMLVDLGRNDIGRVSKIGTVKVEDFMHIEKFSHVMHIVSRVKGALDERFDAFDAFIACFPAGTVSGAPRIRAMEIIDELEPDRRGPYAGALGYFDFRGNMDACITIRSVFFKDDVAYLQAGAGIVADSKPENEFIETENKLGAMLKALGNLKSPVKENLHD